MAAMTSFHAENCCHLVNEHEASVERLRSRVHQFLIYSAFTWLFICCGHIRIGVAGIQ